jgi:hypothetical protein
MISQYLVGRQYTDVPNMKVDIKGFATKNGFAVQQSINYEKNCGYYYCNHRTLYQDKADPETRTGQEKIACTDKCNQKAFVKRVIKVDVSGK